MIFKNYAPFTNCISGINNTQVDDAQDMDIVMHMYNLIKYIDAYSKTSWSLWQNYREEPALDNNLSIIDFPANDNDNILFKFKQKITEQTENRKDAEIIVPLKHLTSFWRTLEIPLITCEITLQLKWSIDCFLVAAAANQVPEIKITDIKLYVPVATLSTQNNIKLDYNLKEQLIWINTYLKNEIKPKQIFRFF